MANVKSEMKVDEEYKDEVMAAEDEGDQEV